MTDKERIAYLEGRIQEMGERIKALESRGYHWQYVPTTVPMPYYTQPYYVPTVWCDVPALAATIAGMDTTSMFHA